MGKFEGDELKEKCYYGDIVAKCPYEFFPKGAWLYGWPYSKIVRYPNYETGEEKYLLCFLNFEDPENLFYEPQGVFDEFEDAYQKMMEHCNKFDPFKKKKDRDDIFSL
jgi:hypothetical protein